MADDPLWPETESEIYQPAIWLVALAGGIFSVVGCIGIVFARAVKPRELPTWVALSFFGVFALVGAALLIWIISKVYWPVRILHASPDVLSGVSTEPVLQEGSTVHARQTHELVAVDRGREFRPAARIQGND